MRAVVDEALGDFRIVILSLGLFAGVALLLAAVGLYGVLAYHVQQRTGEIAVRLALGAPPGTIPGLVLKRGLALVGGGVVLGLVGAWSATRVLGRLLFETRPLDPTTHAIASVFLLAVTLLACALPAWRASRVSLVGALRNE
jgi:putative ABC transport system permease protein